MPQNGLQCLRHLLRWIDDVNLHSKWRSWSSPPPHDGVFWRNFFPWFRWFHASQAVQEFVYILPALGREWKENITFIFVTTYYFPGWHGETFAHQTRVFDRYFHMIHLSIIHWQRCCFLGLPNLNGLLMVSRDLWNQPASAFFLRYFETKTPQSSLRVNHLKISKCGGGRP